MRADRRRYNRLPLSLRGTLELMEQHRPGLAFGITIVDVCPEGVGLISGGALPVGGVVRIAVENNVLQGTVTHCEPQSGHYAAGVKIDPGYGVLARLQWIATLTPSGHPPTQGADRHVWR